VRTLVRTAMVIILSASLAGMPAIAGPAGPVSAPLGVVLQADRAQVGADITSGGATIYDGDRLGTGGEGNLRARLSKSQMYLRPNSSAKVHGFPNGFSADLIGGTVVLSSAEGETFQLLADGATIRPANAQPTVAEITRVSDKELLLTSSRGSVEVSLGDEVKTIEAGSSYRMEVESDDPGPQGQGGPVHSGRRRRLAFYLIIGGVAAGTGIGIWRALVSPDHM
jgi:hypothetical protein